MIANGLYFYKWGIYFEYNFKKTEATWCLLYQKMQRLFRLFNPCRYLCGIRVSPSGGCRAAPEYIPMGIEEQGQVDAKRQVDEDETEGVDEIGGDGWLEMDVIVVEDEGAEDAVDELEELEEEVGLELEDIIALEDAFVREMEEINNASLSELEDMIALEDVRIEAMKQALLG